MKSQLYTRTGDSGTTSLVGGERVKKNSKRLEAYGTIDELSSFIGAITSDAACNAEVKGQLREVQNELFNIGSYLATQSANVADIESVDINAPNYSGNYDCKMLDNAKLQNLEGWIDTLDEQTPKIREFVLPGGCELASKAHQARTVCRRAERAIIDLAESEYVDNKVLKYINRLSDYLFIAARYFNFMQGEEEVVWKK